MTDDKPEPTPESVAAAFLNLPGFREQQDQIRTAAQKLLDEMADQAPWRETARKFAESILASPEIENFRRQALDVATAVDDARATIIRGGVATETDEALPGRVVIQLAGEVPRVTGAFQVELGSDPNAALRNVPALMNFLLPIFTAMFMEDREAAARGMAVTLATICVYLLVDDYVRRGWRLPPGS